MQRQPSSKDINPPEVGEMGIVLADDDEAVLARLPVVVGGLDGSPLLDGTSCGSAVTPLVADLVASACRGVESFGEVEDANSVSLIVEIKSANILPADLVRNSLLSSRKGVIIEDEVWVRVDGDDV